MSEENESRPIEARTETEPRPQTEPRPDRERQRRPRRRYPRRRNYNSDYMNSDRESGFNNDAPAESSSDVQTDVVSAGEGETGEPREPEFGEGIIEISGKGFGFLRDPKRNFVQAPQDIFVTPEIVRRFGLRDGMWIYGETRRGNRGPQLIKLLKINEDEPTKYQGLRPFEELTTINPNKKIKLETVPDRYTTRIMDLMTPLGMGQRGLIVAPPRTGKTTLLHHIADAVVKNHPDMKLIILLVDERPEEVTDFKRSHPKAEIIASSNDSDIKSHTRIAKLAIERAKRRMDELIFQEFKGTGNMEMVLDRKISDQRIYPAIDIFLSGTRCEELLLQPWELEKVNLIRRGLAGHKPGEAIERLLMFVKKFPTNTEMLKGIPG